MKYFVIFLILIGFTGTIFAVPEPVPEDDFRYSDHVITGKIISSEIIIDPREDNSSATFYDTIIYKIKVEKWHKNPLASDTITVYGTRFPNDVIPEPNWGVVEFDIGDTVYLYLDKTDDGLKFREYGSKLLYSKDSGKTEILSPLKQFKSGIKFHNVECNDGLVLAQRGNSERSACVTLDTKIELTIRGWADDDRLLLGCIGERVQKCYPEDKDEYRKALQHYYYESESEDDGILSESDYNPHSPRCGSGVVPYIPKNWQATGKHPSDETWEALGNYLMKQEFYKELQQRNIIFKPACFGVHTGFVEESYPPRFSMCSMVTASNGTTLYLEGMVNEFDVIYFNIDNEIPYQCDDNHFGCLCGIENEN